MDLHSTASPEPVRSPGAVHRDPWGGVWSGRASLRRPDGSAQEFDMELRFPAWRPDRSEPGRAELVYRAGGMESVRSIRLEETPFPDLRCSEVEVNGCRQTAWSTRRGDTLRVTIVARRAIGGRPAVVAAQRAELRRPRPVRT